MLESQGTGREVDSSDRVGIFDRQLKVEGKDSWRTFLEGVWFCRGVRVGRAEASVPARSTESTKSGMGDFIPTGLPALSS
jgi:hypothetical protein